jgi:hypothetical protein
LQSRHTGLASSPSWLPVDFGFERFSENFSKNSTQLSDLFYVVSFLTRRRGALATQQMNPESVCELVEVYQGADLEVSRALELTGYARSRLYESEL